MAEVQNTTTQAITEQDGAQTVGGDPTSTPADGKAPVAQEDEKKFSQKELDEQIGRRLERERAKLEKQFADEKAEAERVAKMTAEEKAKHEQEKRDREYSEREAALAKRERLAVAKDKLAEKNVPLALIAAVDVSADDTIDSSVDAIAKVFADAVSAEVTKRLAAEPPKKSGADVNSLEKQIADIFGNK